MPWDTGTSDVERIILPAGDEWVDVKKSLSVADQRELSRRTRNLFKIGVDGQPVAAPMGDVMEETEYAVLEVAIVRWSAKLQVTPRNIRALDDASIQVIKARLAELYPEPRSDDETKNSGTPSPTPTSTAAASPLTSNGLP